MQLIQFLGILVISYLGLLAGFFLNRIAKEEMAVGKKYFYQLQRIIFFVLLIIFLIWMGLNWILIAIITVLLVILSEYLQIFRKQMANPIIYGLLGIAIALLQDTKYLQLFAGLVFLYGIMAGSFFTEKKDDWKSLLRNNLLYIIAGIVLFLVRRP